jgi:hypothetical protein
MAGPERRARGPGLRRALHGMIGGDADSAMDSRAMEVSGVPDDTETRSATEPSPSYFSLNSDGKRHTLLNAVTIFVCAGGIVAFVLGLFVRAHLAATVLGMACFGLGLYAQLVSATRGERMLLVVGITGGFVGMGMGIAHGGFAV